MTQDTAGSAQQVPTRVPPRWANRAMLFALRTPVLERWLGNQLAILTVTGHRSGTVYRLPVSYRRGPGATWLISTKRQRHWWRNLEQRPEVTLRVRGVDRAGRARVVDDADQATDLMAHMLRGRKMDARAYGLGLDDSGEVEVAQLRTIIDQLVVIEVSPS